MLACPGCHEQLDIPDWGEGDLRCEHCGTVGKWRLGCADFLADERDLRGALNARLDLEHDAAVAAKVAERAPEMEYRELSDYGNALLQNEPVGPPDASTLRGRAKKRYERWYHCV